MEMTVHCTLASLESLRVSVRGLGIDMEKARWEKVEHLKALIDSGSYETAQKLDAAFEAMIEEAIIGCEL